MSASAKKDTIDQDNQELVGRLAGKTICGLRLARWEDSTGSSSGRWLVRETAGVHIYREPDGCWRLGPGIWSGSFADGEGAFLDAVWGEGYNPATWVRICCAENGPAYRAYPTRLAALLALSQLYFCRAALAKERKEHRSLVS